MDDTPQEIAKDARTQPLGIPLDAESVGGADRAALLDERASNELREQLSAILGHELRNPLQAVYASGELLERKLTDPVLAKIAARIRVNARRMSSLIDDVLDLARGRLGGGLVVQLQDVDDLAGALSSVVEKLREGRPERDIASTIDVTRRVRCDLARVQQMVGNLLSNALAHGAVDGLVTFSASTLADDFVVEIWNAGPPIPADSKARMFEPFWRYSPTGTRQGLGLGLYISAQIARAHGGHISVSSVAGEGTTFRVRLPSRAAS